MTEIIRYTYGLQNPTITTDKVDSILTGLSNDENIVSITWTHEQTEKRFLPITKIVALVNDVEQYISRLHAQFSKRFVFTNREDVQYRAAA